jgi:DNA mismatch repair protein MSH2
LRKKNSFTVLDTRKDGVRFTNGKMKKLSKESAALKQQYEEIQSEIVAKAVEITCSYTPVLELLNELLAELDVLAAFAHVAANAPVPYCRPEVHSMGTPGLTLKGSRHPCMEALDGVTFIENDVELVKGESNVQVITGPNMGGKSTYIRQVGVISLMAQVGCYVPCQSCSVAVVDCILARVGAGDSQLKGVSTFMKEMLEASHILNGATEHSLIIIDELGRGTSTYDGFGLAWAIAEHIASKVGAFALFATHFHELTALASSEASVVNRHVTAHTDAHSISMLYQVREGPCDRSFGIHVSELANFPAEVVAAAKRKVEMTRYTCILSHYPHSVST